ncbi:MAG: hypothetical protein A3K67_02455 [Euryarchaeota archaeon RBG_16_62_10]|nr:MAG: hypothetical protein A3K67_02455 [Euryarchaeota archaeon RBG_16_62_10]
MGISPIEYRPWKGVRTAQKLRLYVIARSVVKHKLRSAGVIVLLVLGFFLVHTLSLLFIVLLPHEELEASDMNSYLGSGLFATFSMLLAAVVTSDLISEDLSNNSFVLYFSRALKIRDYLTGKAGGALFVMSLVCAFPPVLVATVSMATQTGSDYWGGAAVLGKTALVGLLVTVFFVPFGLMVSSFTKRKSYAAIGTFMSFFVLEIVAQVFSEFDRAWEVVSPIESLSFLFDWVYEGAAPYYVGEGALVGVVSAFIVIPAAVVYLRLVRQVVGR